MSRKFNAASRCAFLAVLRETVRVPPYSPDALRRRPDLEGPDLLASDAADRLILDESAAARSTAPAGAIVVIGDEYGALTLGAAGAGGYGLRVHPG